MSHSSDEETNTKSCVTRVLIIDDRLDEVAALKLAFENKGVSVTYSADPNVGLAIIETDPPDLLILDLMMPKRSGFLVLERIVGLQQSPFPVMMTTSINGERHRKIASQLGVCAYLQKPYSIDRAVETGLQLIQEFNQPKKSPAPK